MTSCSYFALRIFTHFDFKLSFIFPSSTQAIQVAPSRAPLLPAAQPSQLQEGPVQTPSASPGEDRRDPAYILSQLLFHMAQLPPSL